MGIVGPLGPARRGTAGLSSSAGLFRGPGRQLQRRLECLQRGHCGSSFAALRPQIRLDDRELSGAIVLRSYLAAGRMLALVSLPVSCLLVGLVVWQLNRDYRSALFSGLFCSAVFCIA